MITIKQIESPAVVTDGVTNVNLYAGQTYTCEVPEVDDWRVIEIDTTISGITPSDSFLFYMTANMNILIDWGDGTTDDLINYNGGLIGIYPTITHQYSVGGVYEVKYKTGNELTTGGGTDYTKVTKVKNFGSYINNSHKNAFRFPNAEFIATDKLPFQSSLSQPFFGNQNMAVPPEIQTFGMTTFNLTFGGTNLNADLGYMDLRTVTDMTNFASSVTTWSQANYEATWVGWLGWSGGVPTKTLKNNVPFHGGSSTVGIGSDGAAARSYAINTLGWVVTDGGEV